MSNMENNATESLEDKLENMRKSRDEFKAQVSALKETAMIQGEQLEEQRELITKLINAVCDLSKAVKR